MEVDDASAQVLASSAASAAATDEEDTESMDVALQSDGDGGGGGGGEVPEENGRVVVSPAKRRGRPPLKRVPVEVEEDEVEEEGVEMTEEELQAEAALLDELEEANTTTESGLTATPLKLEVSGSEDEADDSLDTELPVQSVKTPRKRGPQKNGKNSPRRQLAKSPEAASKSTFAKVAHKRKRYEVRRSGSEECLLGFDELNGEAMLVKDPTGELLINLHQPKAQNEETALSPSLDSPQTSKKFKRSPSATPSIKASPRSQPSPAPATPRTKPPKPVPGPQKAEQHIVADNEEVEPPPPAELQTSDTSALAPGTPIPKKPPSLKDDYYRKPFEYGWKRELVYRANVESSKDKADVYFITPTGKKVRTRSDIAPHLQGELTLDHFNFAREPMGLDPEHETVRIAKPSHRSTIAAATLAAAPPQPAHPGKRISKPKVPKGASPPPQGWTPTRALKTNNAALLSSAGSSKYSGSNPSTPPNSRGVGGGSAKSSKTKKPVTGAEAGNSLTPGVSVSVSSATHEPCTMLCPLARGQVPQLQCVKCLCHYHHECVGLSRSNCEYRATGQSTTSGARDYVCESCVPLTASKTPAPAVAPAAKTPAAPNAKNASSQNAKTLTASTPKSSTGAIAKASTGSAAKTSSTAAKVQSGPNAKATNKKPPAEESAVRMQRPNKLPQTIAVVKGKKYVMVSKPHVPPAAPRAVGLSVEQLNDIENDLKQINESIRKNRKQSTTSLDAAFQPNNVAAEVAQKTFGTNFFANVSFAYDALLCILKYLKIHERPRAASVCKLWHLAAKDTSLWQTVRMKNSKISDWSGFAAALRRGETKHLDLRKILLSSTKADEMWSDFSKYIGTVYSLESIDLCRCSTKVVESLFLSNPNLRVLNAVAINDESFGLENIDKLQMLTELRLRTCEPGTLDGDLQPLRTLTNLSHLSLTSLLGLGTKSIEVLGELVNLKSLELGECGDFDSGFALEVLPKLVNLQRLRLENGQKTSCCTLQILDAVATLEHLSQLEFVNFDIKPGFDDKLLLCKNLRKLLIIPTYISQSATTNQIVLNAVQQIADSLKVFTWGVTVELLRVTALYVDQCEESTKKEKHHFDECIPVMKPVPGAPPSEAQDDEMEDLGPNAVPQIEILPLDKVESILGDNLTTTKFTIVKVPYQATCKQHLVE